MMTMDDEIVSKSIDNFVCNNCKYITQHKSNFVKHCSTAKHIQRTKDDKIVSDYICSCGKIFKYRQGLHKHKNKCSPDQNKNIIVENPPIDTSLIIKLIQQNENLQNLLVQQATEYAQKQSEQVQKQSELMNKLIEREPMNNITNNNNTTNNVQKFNLNFFLNETCKDAMTIQEFLDSIRITFEDLLLIGNTGFVNGVSDILIKQLRDLDVSKRPIHCTDSKRDTIYLKENAAWNKDDKDKTKLKQILEKIEYRNVVALRDWCNENPDARVNNTPNNLLKDKIYFQTLQGDDKTRDKIIKNISKEVMVDKDN
jgi:hypothetical protein